MDYEKTANKLAEKIEKNFESHGINIEITGWKIVNKDKRYIFEVKLKRGTKVDSLYKCAYDIQIKLHLPLFRVEKKGLQILIVVSEQEITDNNLTKILHSPTFTNSVMKLPYAMGYDAMGKMCVEDLAKFPQLAMGGVPQSGKSTALRCLILSLITKLDPNHVNLLLFDIGAEDLTLFSKIPHLSHPIVKDVRTGIEVIMNLKEEMERRIPLKENNPVEYNRLPYIVCIIDEFVSLILGVNNKKLCLMLINTISNLIMRGRHGKVHLVVSTQDPTVENTKININIISARIAFACAKHQNSTTIIGMAGANKLRGNGEMLFKYGGEIKYLQGAYISSEKAKGLVKQIIHSYSGYLPFVNQFIIDKSDSEPLSLESTYESAPTAKIKKVDRVSVLLPEIIMWTLGNKQISINAIQKQFHLGYTRARAFADTLMDLKLITETFEKLPRSVIPSKVEDLTADVMKILTGNGHSANDIDSKFNNKQDK